MGDKFIPNVISATLDSLPFIGNIKAGVELITGKDLITQSKLDDFDKALNMASIGLSGGAKALGKLAKNAAKGGKVLRKAETFTKGTQKCCESIGNIKRFNDDDDE